MTDIVVPKLSATMDEARVLKWLKPLGAAVKAGDALVELETDKAALEVEATASGSLAEILVAEGDMAPIGAVLARITAAGEKPQSAVQTGAPGKAPSVARGEASLSPARRAAVSAEARVANASPLARRLAREHGIELAAITGSAYSGRIQSSDLAALIGGRRSSSSSAAISPLRRRIAARVTESRRNLPSFWLDRWVSVAEAEAAIERARAIGVKATFTDILLRAMARAARNHSKFRQVWNEQTLRETGTATDIPIGLVVATEDGVAIPVLSGLADASLATISDARRRAAEQARAGKVSEAMLRPTALSLSNLSSSGIDRFEAIIDPDQSAILTVGRIHERVVPIKGGVGVAWGCHLTLSVDHRLIDGRDGASFLGDVASAIESPWE